ncbi:hypothetical protein BDR26DRAFT_869946 [Obelidium mucronatum]|nr:hypothetical protein BDR26DRAFT_869946 [Obelidium mucronatum]
MPSIVYVLSISSTASHGTSLADAFEILEAQKTSLEITEYALSQVSLEQVFIDFARAQGRKD